VSSRRFNVPDAILITASSSLSEIDRPARPLPQSPLASSEKVKTQFLLPDKPPNPGTFFYARFYATLHISKQMSQLVQGIEMLDGVAAKVLTRLCGHYVQAVDASQLQTDIWNGKA
jgi:hypothetical protein